MKGRVFNIQRFSTDDGVGIRTCVFLKGCPLNCLWCHNAEGISFSPEILFYKEKCIGCAECKKTCSRGAVTIENGSAEIERKLCNACGSCAATCPSGAISIVGKEMAVSEVIEQVLRDRAFYGKDGGLTISGGEPLSQPDFTIALAAAAKSEGISVAVETSGFGKTEDYLSLASVCDIFLFDCKASSESHKKLVGVDDDIILKNLEALCKSGSNVILRCPIVKNLNDDVPFFEKIICLASAYKEIQCVQLMPYHSFGTQKAKYLGKEPQPLFETPDEEELKKILLFIEKKCKKIIII